MIEVITSILVVRHYIAVHIPNNWRNFHRLFLFSLTVPTGAI